MEDFKDMKDIVVDMEVTADKIKTGSYLRIFAERFLNRIDKVKQSEMDEVEKANQIKKFK